MAWFGRNREAMAAEALLVQGFYEAALAAAESYEIGMSRVDEGDVYTLFGKLRTSHMEYADDFRKRLRKLGGNPDNRTGAVEWAARTVTRIQSAGSVRDLLIAMRLGEENGVAMGREALEEADLSGKTRSMIESYTRMHIDNIRDLSEQIALRGTYTGTMAEFDAPQWLRYPKPAFWVFEAGVLLLGYLFGRGGRKQAGGAAQQSQIAGERTSPRAKLGGDQAVEQHGETIAREVGQ